MVGGKTLMIDKQALVLKIVVFDKYGRDQNSHCKQPLIIHYHRSEILSLTNV